jgi:hypothetical protein
VTAAPAAQLCTTDAAHFTYMAQPSAKCNPKIPSCCVLLPLLSRFRELGCSSTAVRIKVASEGAGPADEAPATSYNITLLASGTKTLAQSFPRPKMLKKAGPR